MASNGKLPSSQLARIYHPSYKLYLEKNAAASWNTMRIFLKHYAKVDIYPAGPISAYRTYAQQVEAKKIYGDNAATPGTSNHGWGLAVDLASTRMRTAIDSFGAYFGWAKKWSDASWEWWHLKYKAGVWKQRPDPGINAKRPIAKLGSGGRGQKWYVRKIQRRLRAHGFKVNNSGGEFDKNTHRAVKAFQQSKKLKTDGVVGRQTWKKLLEKPKKNNKPAKPEKPAPVKPVKPDPVKPVKPAPVKQKAEIIDVSNHQPNINFEKVKKDGIAGVYFKLSEGQDWRDKSTDAPRIQSAKAAGLKYGFYHFLRPKKRDAALEARFFIEQANKLGGWGDYLPCADIEVTELNSKETGDYLARFISVLRREGNVKNVLIYASPGWWVSYVKLTDKLWTQIAYSYVWVAHWNVQEPQNLRGFDDWVLHQYTEEGRVSGIDGFVDRNKTRQHSKLQIRPIPYRSENN